MIKEKLHNINQWYDNIKDPYRLGLFMLLVITAWIPSLILIFLGINNDFVQILPTIILIPFGFIRWLWITGRLHVVGK